MKDLRMASSLDTASLEILLGSSKRVLRNQSSLQDLIAAYPSLREKCLSAPSTLSDMERRMLLDFPDEEMERENIKSATDLSRSELIAKAVADPTSLTEKELELLANRFWGPGPPDESTRIFSTRSKPGTLNQFEADRRAAYLSNEKEALSAAVRESFGRPRREREREKLAAAEAAIPYAKDWIQQIYKNGRASWGFVCLYDSVAQTLDPEYLEDFACTLEPMLRTAIRYGGSGGIIGTRWRLPKFNAPDTAFLSSTNTADVNQGTNTSSGVGTNPRDPLNFLSGVLWLPDTEPATGHQFDVRIENGAVFRDAFKDILRDPQQYEKRPDVKPIDPTPEYKDGIAASGFLTNTFLVFDLHTIKSIEDGRYIEDLRVLALEADFPVEGKKYAEGYQGYTWVRLDQLVYNFYELRSTKADEVGMDEIWKASLRSRNQAFVSLDPEEAMNHQPSSVMGGFSPESVLGKRWYSMKAVREKDEAKEEDSI
jgi:hypothetical protein